MLMNVSCTIRRRDGFVMPAVMFAMAILTIFAIAALATSGDDRASSNAVRNSAHALALFSLPGKY